MKNRTTEASGHIALRPRAPRAKPALARGRLRPQKLHRPKYRYVAVSTDPPHFTPLKDFKPVQVTGNHCGQERRAPGHAGSFSRPNSSRNRALLHGHSLKERTKRALAGFSSMYFTVRSSCSALRM